MLFLKRWWRSRFPKPDENTATKRLCRILNKSPKSRKALTRMLRNGGFNMPLIVRAKTQVRLDDRSRPDMAGEDRTHATPLLVESKFGARLRPGQASNYLRHTNALLFIAPEARVEKLWKEIVQQIGKRKLGPTTSAKGWRSTMVSITRLRSTDAILSIIPKAWRPKRATRFLALISWDRLISKMTAPDVAKEVGKLRRLVNKLQRTPRRSARARRGIDPRSAAARRRRSVASPARARTAAPGRRRASTTGARRRRGSARSARP